jgi:TorA maturation chaperone TorD
MHDRDKMPRARSRGYNLLSTFMARGLTRSMLPLLRAVDALEAALPADLDAESAAAAHYEVFGRTIFACEDVFLDPMAQRGGRAAERLAATHTRIGFTPPTSLEADELACELAALSHLCAAEADAWQDGYAGAAHQARALQTAFLHDHLLRWLPPLCEALGRQPQPLYAALAVLLWEMVSDHAAELGALLPSPAAAAPPSAPDPGAANTSLAELASWLLAPASAGFLLTRTDLQTVAEEMTLPTGFVDRRTLLTDLLRAAGAHDALAALLDILVVRAAEASACYAELAAERAPLADWVRPWAAHTATTQALLAAMHAEIQRDPNTEG